MDEKRPRHWAAEIAALASLNERRAVLAQVPDHLRPLVETHLRNIWNLKKISGGENDK